VHSESASARTADLACWFESGLGDHAMQHETNQVLKTNQANEEQQVDKGHVRGCNDLDDQSNRHVDEAQETNQDVADDEDHALSLDQAESRVPPLSVDLDHNGRPFCG